MIKVSDLIEDVKELAREHPDKTAECVYFLEGEPCCIVGHALAKRGITAKDAIEGDYNYGVAVTALPDYGVIEDDFRALVRLSEVQDLQDYGKPWGEAIKVLG